MHITEGGRVDVLSVCAIISEAPWEIEYHCALIVPEALVDSSMAHRTLLPTSNRNCGLGRMVAQSGTSILSNGLDLTGRPVAVTLL